MEDEWKVTYQRDTDANYMMIEDSDRYETEYFCLRMLNEQNIPGLLDMDMMELDNTIQYRFQITSKVSFLQMCEKNSIQKEWIKDILCTMIETIQNAKKYMLNEHDFVIHPTCIYLDSKNITPFLCYLSGYHKDIKEQITDFLQFCLDRIDYEDKVAVVYVYSLHKAMVVSEITLGEFQKLVMEEGKEQGRESGKQIRNETRKGHVIEQEKEHRREPRRDDRKDERREERKGQRTENSQDQAEGCSDYRIQEETISVNTDITHKGVRGVEMDLSDEEDEFSPDVERKGLVQSFHFSDKPLLLQIVAAVATISLFVLAWKMGIFHSSFDQFMMGRFFLAGVLAVLLNVLLYYVLFFPRKRRNRQSIVSYEELLSSKSSAEKRSGEERAEKGDSIVPAWNKDRGESIWDIHNKEDGIRRGNMHNPDSSYGMKVNENLIAIAGLEEEDKTCILNAAMSESFCYLKACKENHYSDIYFSSFPYYIGKKKGEVDYYMDESVISRYHAKVTMEKGKYYVTDLNSMNGTFVNGKMLNVNETYEMVIGDRVGFANLDFYLVSNERRGK